VNRDTVRTDSASTLRLPIGTFADRQIDCYPAHLGKVTQQTERRSSPRFPIECSVRYRVKGIEESGSGKTVNISSGGVLMAIDRILSPGSRVEVEIDWPVKLDDGVPIKLVVSGRVVRSKEDDIALAGVKMLRYAFHTASR